MTSNRTWGRAIVCGLQKLGAGRIFISPGARGSALVAAVAEEGIDSTIHYDERGMSFAALGWAMATGRPTVCITTSGSAVANLLPACVEAFHSGVPLIFVTADRPPELRGTGANQTIHQPGIFSSFVRAEVGLPCPDDLATLPAILENIYAAATSENPGPVHLNVPFPEPVLPDLSADVESVPGEEGSACQSRIGDISKASPDLTSRSLLGHFFDSPYGVILVGRLPLAEQTDAALLLDLSNRLGWPLIADALSGARLLPGVIGHADWILQSRNVPAPERVLHFGGSLVSKRLGEWMAPCCGENYLQVRHFPERLDPWHQSPTLLRAGIPEFLDSLSIQPRPGWRDVWLEAKQAVAEILSEVLDTNQLSEPAIARAVAANSSLLFLGNSMPIRDFNSCVDSKSSAPIQILGNRGASGIDGNIATIAGISSGAGKPVTALVGDLTLLHDLNSLALLRGEPVSLVVVNNDGGGIFQFLPLGIDPAERERFWETPHGMDFEHAAAQFGLEYHRPADMAELAELLAQPPLRARLIECRTDRAANHALHLEISRKVATQEWKWTR
jgi:2-succinyl-5-enolpyruvyl-6-hydroxy-3-cyclohexene-1-carboxylate synthase